MSALAFDTLKLAQNLRDKVKFSPEQAEQLAQVLSSSTGDWLIAQEWATKSDISAAKAGVNNLIAATKVEIVKWVIGVGFAQVAMIIATLKFH